MANRKKSAALLVYRKRAELEVLLGHPGGPYFRKKEDGHWTIPKGEFEDPETPESAALREFGEETGLLISSEPFYLGETNLRSGKTIYCFAICEDPDISQFRSNSFEIEWPPHSGRRQAFPELDRLQWFTREEAQKKISPGQTKLLELLFQREGRD